MDFRVQTAYEGKEKATEAEKSDSTHTRSHDVVPVYRLSCRGLNEEQAEAKEERKSRKTSFVIERLHLLHSSK